MVEKSICPNCGEPMDLGNLYLSGSAECKKCGYKGLPIGSSDFVKGRIRKIKEKREAKPETQDPLDLHELMGKISIIWAGLLLISILMPEMRSFAPVSLIGLILFAASYKLMGQEQA